MNTAGSKKWLNYLILIVFLVITILPIIFLVMLSVKSSTEVITGNVLSLPEEFCWDNFYNAWTKGKVNQYFMNSVIVTVASTFFVTSPTAFFSTISFANFTSLSEETKPTDSFSTFNS